MKNYQTTEGLESILANLYGLYLKTQNYHWNVTGPNFKAIHELLELQYTDMAAAIDEIAERIRTLGEKVEGTFDNFYKLNECKPADKDKNASDMVKDLVSDNEAMVKKLKAVVKIAEEDGDNATADMLIARTQIHEKAIWMLKSSM